MEALGVKHAYLILAHGQFDLLTLLVSALDDVRNDIYIHIDAKVRELPELSIKAAGLYLLEDRVDVRWGDVSVIEAEFALMQAASSNCYEYAYYHLLSGVDLPIKTQDYIHSFFAEHAGREFVGFNHAPDLERSLTRKVRRWHLFPKDFRGEGLCNLLKRILRAVFIRVQELFSIERNSEVMFRKGTQWFSITDRCVRGVLSERDKILRLYRYTFCPDEIFLQTYLAHTPLKDNVYDYEDEGRGCMRCIGWRNNQLADFKAEDLDMIRSSEALFARKFNNQDQKFLAEIIRLGRGDR